MSTETQCLLITKTFSLKGRDSLEHWLNVFGAWGPNRVKGTNIPDFLLSWLSLIIIKLLKKYHVESQRRPICRCTTEHKCSHSAGLFDYSSSGSFWRHGVGGSSPIYRPWEAIDPGKPQRKPLSLQWPKKTPPAEPSFYIQMPEDVCLGRRSCMRRHMTASDPCQYSACSRMRRWNHTSWNRLSFELS